MVRAMVGEVDWLRLVERLARVSLRKRLIKRQSS
jgi:hypothetical protein